MQTIYDEYIDLLNSYLIGSINAETLQRDYIEKFKTEIRPMSDNLYEILDTFFADIDAFCPDPILLIELKKTKVGQYLNEKELHERIKITVKLIEKIKSQEGKCGSY